MQLVTDPWSDADLDRLAALERAQSTLEAGRATVLARMHAATDARELGWAGQAPWASLLLEVAGTCRVSQVTAGNRLDDATHLVDRLPGTHAALAAGAPQQWSPWTQDRNGTTAATSSERSPLRGHVGPVCG